MKLFYNLLFKRGGKNVHIYIYLSTNLLLFITFITLLLQSFKTFENRSNNREHTHIYYTIIKREDNSSRRVTFKNVETKNSYRVKLTNPPFHPSIRTDRTLHAALTPKLARFHMKQPALWPDLIRHGRRSSVHRCYNFRRSVR